MVIGCLRLSDVIVICRVVTEKKSGRLLVRGVQAGDDFELIPMVEMETTNPVEGYFDNEFRRSVIIAELWWPEVARR